MIEGWVVQLWPQRKWNDYRDSILIYKAFRVLANEDNMPRPGQLIPAMGKVVKDEAPAWVSPPPVSREESRRGYEKFKKSIQQYRDNPEDERS